MRATTFAAAWGSKVLPELAKFVQEGGTLITEGSTAAFVADYGLASGVTVEHPAQLLRARIDSARDDCGSQESRSLTATMRRICRCTSTRIRCSTPAAVEEAVDSAAAAAAAGRRRWTDALAPNITPNAVPIHVSPYDEPAPVAPQMSQAEEQAAMRQQMRAFGIVEEARPRVVMAFAQNPNDMLLSGTLAGGQALSGHPAVIDVPFGKGHIVMFALRPFWRWQTQGTYFLGFNAILNWNHLDAGKEEPRQRQRTGARQ